MTGLMQEEERFRAEADRATEILMKLLAEDVALALTGPKLRNETIARLQSEEIRESWEAGRNQGNSNLDRYVADIAQRLANISPPIQGELVPKIEAEVRAAWDALWYPAPDGCADSFRHPALMGSTRGQTIARLTAVGRRSAGELSGLVNKIRTSVDTAEAKKRERLALEQRAPEAEALAARLKEVSESIARLQLSRDTARRSVEALEGTLGKKRQEFGRYTDSIGRGAPALKRAAYADKVSKLIDDILADAVPTQVGAVATAMTKAWKSMAHMADRVDRIEITPECEVRMLNKRGENLHEIEKSAGASQVFTQALIWAITHVSQQDFPFVVDTPLARLSRDQRIGVLKTFTERTGQVILLSTDEEVVDDKLEAIRDRIAQAYQLKVRSDDGVAVTSLETEKL